MIGPKVNKQNILFYVTILFVLVYTLSRGSFLIFIPLLFLLLVLLRSPQFDFIKNYIRTHKRMLLYIFAALYLISTFFHFRVFSSDGLNLYLKNTLLLKDKSDIYYYDYPLYPYLAELFLGKIYGLTKIFNFVNVTFGIVTLAALASTTLVYKSIGIEKKVSKLALLLLVTSPTIAVLATVEYKIDLFLLLATNISLYFFISFLRNKNYINVVFLGFSLAISSLIKLTALPFAFIIIVLVLINLIHTRISIKFKFACGVVLVASFFIPLLIWTLSHGTILNGDFVINRDLSTRIHSYLNVNKQIREVCFSELSKQLKRNEMFPGNNPLDKMLQPFYYATARTGDGSNYDYSFFNPGIFIYLSIILFIFLPLLYKNLYKDRALFYLYLLTCFYIVTFYMLWGVALWYLIPVFPVVALFYPLVLEKTPQSSLYGYFKYLIYSFMIVQLTFTLIVYIKYFAPSWNLSIFNYKNEYVTKVFKINDAINKLPKGSLVLLASERNLLIPVAFVHNADKRVVYSNYYFVSSGKPLSNMYTELKRKNINYIVVDTSVLNDTWYQGCAKKNNEILSGFLKIYANPIYGSKTSNYIYKLK